MVLPSGVGVESDLRHDNCPREDPKDVRDQTLVEVPAWNGGEENGRELGRYCVEDVAPVNSLYKW
jgi:hypothetical protein